MLTKIGIRRLLKVRRQILAEPKKFAMSWWTVNSDSGNFDGPSCGTAHCIGGWLLRNARKGISFDPGNRAALLLGLNSADEASLFFTEHWPEDLRIAYRKTKNQKNGHRKRARIAARAIDWFIKKYGPKK